MRKIVMVLILVGVIAAGWNTERVDIGKLKPVEAVRISVDSDRVVIQTDTDDTGTGDNVTKAIENLKKTTEGVLYLDTADYLIVTENAEDKLWELESTMRRGCRIVLERDFVDLKRTAKFLSAHDSKLTLRQYLNGESELPQLVAENGRISLVSGGGRKKIDKQ